MECPDNELDDALAREVMGMSLSEDGNWMTSDYEVVPVWVPSTSMKQSGHVLDQLLLDGCSISINGAIMEAGRTFVCFVNQYRAVAPSLMLALARAAVKYARGEE